MPQAAATAAIVNGSLFSRTVSIRSVTSRWAVTSSPAVAAAAHSVHSRSSNGAGRSAERASSLARASGTPRAAAPYP